MTITRLVCSGCGAEVPREVVWPFRCPNAAPGDDVDHVVTRLLDTTSVDMPLDSEPNPYVRWRRLFHVWHVGRAGGLSDSELVGIIRELDAAVETVDGRGFVETPITEAPALRDAVGLPRETTVWVKDETRNVSGSHKARHLFGVLLWLAVMERLGHGAERPPLAIASCGNAALAAAVLARAAGRELDVFIPKDADPRVVERLTALGARIATCLREPGVVGDPCYHGFKRALEAGALPFCCQGPDNGLTVEGGHTLGWEIAAQLARRGRPVDRVLIQVGGGALASAVTAALREAVALGVLTRMPRIHAVQTEGGWPLLRAFERMQEHMEATGNDVQSTLRHAAMHRSAFMWPWEEEPHSIAHGILDDETYDWHAIVRAMLETGGWPIAVSEDELVRANELVGATTDIPADHTGTSGVAGLLRLCAQGAVSKGESVAVLLTGARR